MVKYYYLPLIFGLAQSALVNTLGTYPKFQREHLAFLASIWH